MRIILIRHGETYANELYHSDDRILIGALDTPVAQLNEIGRKQALKAKEKLEGIQVDEIYSSNLGRTQETASIIFDGRPFTTTPLLRERSLGSDEGKKASIVFADPNVWQVHVNSDTDPIEDCMNKRVSDGENYAMVFERCKKFLSQFDYDEDKTIACVAHFHLIRCMIYVLLEKQPDRELMQMMIPNACPLIFDYEEGKFVYKG